MSLTIDQRLAVLAALPTELKSGSHWVHTTPVIVPEYESWDNVPGDNGVDPTAPVPSKTDLCYVLPIIPGEVEPNLNTRVPEFYYPTGTLVDDYGAFLVFEDDGGGWHHEPTVESWVSFSIIPGNRYLYNIRSKLHEYWDASTSLFNDERGELRRGTLNLYICSTDKRLMQTYEFELANTIERTRLGLSLDYEGVTTGPENSSPRYLGSYVDNRLRKRVYRTLLEVPILYKFSLVEIGYPIKKIELEPWAGYPLAEMEHLFIRSPLLITADAMLAESSSANITASMVLDLVEPEP